MGCSVLIQDRERQDVALELPWMGSWRVLNQDTTPQWRPTDKKFLFKGVPLPTTPRMDLFNLGELAHGI